MFCHKCGAQLVEGSAFCPKCGTKVMQEEAAQQPADAPTSGIQPQNDQPAAPENTPKPRGKSSKIGIIGRVLMWGSLLLLFFSGLPIFAIGAVIGTILSVVGTKRPWGLSKIIELVVAVIVLVIALVTTLSSGGSGDKYIQMVKDGTLNGYPQMTVGEAFDGFLSSPKWESGLSDDNVRFVNVTGGALYNDEEVELAVQFIVDEKTGSFEYNACEVDGTPQSNLVFWGLLEAIYNGDSSPEGMASQGGSSSMSDQIVVGETQSYDNEFGNMEVTLDYIQFADSLENTWTGAYTYPDEGSVFLLASVTVKNIGTEKGSLLTAWNTLIFDGEYEFGHYTTIGDSLTDINPLTAPTTGALVFMVPTSIMESDKSLVLNINDGGGEAVLSYVIRPGDGTSGTGDMDTPNSIDVGGGATIFAGGPYGLSEVSSLLGTSVESIMNDWGTPLEYEAGAGVNYCIYDGITFNFDADGVIYTIDLDPSKCVTKAETLDKNREALLDILGTPTEEGWEPAGYTDMYRMRYEDFMDGMGFVIEMTSPDDVASSMRIWQN